MTKRKRNKKPMALATALLIVAGMAIIAGLALSGDDSETPINTTDSPPTAATPTAAVTASATASVTTVDIIATEPEAKPEITYCRITLYDGKGAETASKEIASPEDMSVISALNEKLKSAYNAEGPLELADIITANKERVEIVYAEGGKTHIALVYDLGGCYFQKGALRMRITDTDCANVLALFNETEAETLDNVG